MWKEFCREREPPKKKAPGLGSRGLRGSKEGFSSNLKITKTPN